MASGKYDKLGVSASKNAVHSALKQAGLKESGSLFANVVEDMADDHEFVSFLHSDGAGTKSIVAYLLFRETGDPSHFAGLAQDALAMNIDDVFCLGTPSGLVLGNAIARNASHVPGEAIAALISSYTKLRDKLAGLGISVAFSGGETADCGDVVRTLLVDATLAGRIEKSRLIDQKRIVPGNVIVGISSTGRTNYEEQENSGIGSNGLTLARHSLLSKYHCERYPEVVDPMLSVEATYQGPYRVTDKAEGQNVSVGEMLASPTRIYAPILQRIYQELPQQIFGAIHVTGGALTKVLRFGEGNVIVKNSLFPAPPLFSLIQEHGKVSWREMYQVFNMGHRIELYLSEKNAVTVIDVVRSFGIEAKVIGHVEKNPDSVTANKVKVESPNGNFEYELTSR